MRARICSSDSRMSRLGLLNSELTCAEEVANSFLLLNATDWSSKTFAWAPRGATYYESSSFRSMRHSPNYPIRILLLVVALAAFIAPAYAQSAAIQPCDATPSTT